MRLVLLFAIAFVAWAQEPSALFSVTTTTDGSLTTTAGVVQPNFGGGICVTFGFHNTSSGPCQDLYIQKYGEDGKTVMAATYLGGNDREFLVGYSVDADGSLLLALQSYSRDFLVNSSSDTNQLLIRLAPDLSRVLQWTRLPVNCGLTAFSAGSGAVYLGCVAGVEYGMLRVDLDSFSLRWRRELPGTPYSPVVLRLGDLLVAAVDERGTGHLLRLEPETGTVVRQVAIEAGYYVNLLAPLPNDSFILAGTRLATGITSAYYTRYDGKMQPVEKPQWLGQTISSLSVSPAGLIRMEGSANPGLPVTPNAPHVCRGPNERYFRAELPWNAGGPTLVTWLSSGTSAVPCLDPELQTYAYAINRANLGYTGSAAYRSAVPPGELVTVYGSGLGVETVEFRPEVTGGIPTEVAGTRVLLDGVPLGIVALGPYSATVAIPFGLAGKPGMQLQLERDGRVAAELPLTVIPAAPVILDEPQSGGLRLGAYAKGQLVTEANPVHPGDEVAVYLTGMGDWNQTVDPNRVVGERNGLTPVREVRAFVEGSGYQQVVYAGAVPGQLPGLSQVNVRIAPDLKFVGN